MTTTKFSPGDRVRAYEALGVGRGIVLSILGNGNVQVDFGAHGGIEIFHPKQLRRLRKKTSVVWESTYPIGTNDVGDGIFRLSDEVMLEKFSLSKFIGKRVRIEITEAKEKP